MARYTPQNFGGDLSPLNPEFENIKQAIDDTLSRVGDTPNAVTTTIDMNGQRLINLSAPVSANEPARLKDVQGVAQTLPDQTGNNNKYLKTDGNVATWQDAVNSFKGRVGEVQPQADDYTANQIASVNGYVQTDLDSLGSRVESIETTYNNSQWDSAYSWGDHALAGYFDSTTGKADTLAAEAGTDDSQWMSSEKTHAAFQKFGLGTTVSKTANLGNVDLNTDIPTGMYRIDEPTNGLPTNLKSPTDFYYSPCFIIRTSDTAKQTIWSQSTGRAVTRVGQGVSSITWKPWQEIYTSAVLNVNEFSVGTSNDVIAQGYAISSDTALFFLPISSYSPPTSITTTNAFKVTEVDKATLVSANTTPTISGASSNKFAVLTATGLSGQSLGKPLLLIAEDSTSKITVNV